MKTTAKNGIDIKWIPMGQKVLQAGYRNITEKEIRIELGDKERFAYERHGTKYYKWVCDLRQTDLDLWLLPIPPKCLELISLAHEIGLTDLCVWECVKKSKPLDDPIVTAYWNDMRWFITRWK